MKETNPISDVDALSRLHQLGLRYLRENDLEPVLAEIVEAAIAFSAADFGSIQVFEPKTSHLKLVAQRGFDKWWVDFWDRVHEGKGVCGTALESGERVIVEDIEKSPIFVGSPMLEIQLKAGVRAVQSTPLRGWTGNVIGMFSTHYRHPYIPGAQALRALDLLAFQAASIIERAQIMEKEREMQRQVDIAMELKTFNDIVSHDLREPIRTAGCLLELFLQTKEDMELVQSAAQATRRTLTLLDAISGYTRVGQGEEPISNVDLGVLLAEVQQNLKSFVEEREGQTSVGPMPTIRGRRAELSQLFQNLVMNAHKYRRKEVPPQVTVTAVRRKDAWLITIADNGSGFDPKFAGQLFVPFRRFHTDQPGTGIGLAICKKIVDRHRGGFGPSRSREQVQFSKSYCQNSYR
jgi:signal transduction histidine kinase